MKDRDTPQSLNFVALARDTKLPCSMPRIKSSAAAS